MPLKFLLPLPHHFDINLLLFKDINATKNWYCYHQNYVRDHFLFKETDKKTNTTYYEMYFSAIPAFKEQGKCFVNIYNHHNILEETVYIHEFQPEIVTRTDTSGDTDSLWSVRLQGTEEYQKALYTVSKIHSQREFSGPEGKYIKLNT